MTYPQQPAQPGYPYPPAPQGPPPGPYAQPQYPPQGFLYPPQAPVQPPVEGSLSDYFSQPSTGSGASWSFKGKPEGTTYEGYVARKVIDSDIRQQTDPVSQQPTFYRDGRPKFVMVVPFLVAASPEFPEGKADWFVGGAARDELRRAMDEAGAPAGSAPEQGAFVRVTLTGRKPGKNPGLNPSNQYAVLYVRPQGTQNAGPVPAAEQPQTAVSPQGVTYIVEQPVQPPVQAPQAPVPTGVQQYAPPGVGPNGNQPQYAAPGPVQQVAPTAAAPWPQHVAQQMQGPDLPPGGYVPPQPASQGGVLVQPDHQAVAPAPWGQPPAPAQQYPPVVGPPQQPQGQPGTHPMSPEELALMQRLTAPQGQ